LKLIVPIFMLAVKQLFLIRIMTILVFIAKDVYN